MSKEGFPFKHNRDEEKIISGSDAQGYRGPGRENMVYEFEDSEGNKWIRKERKLDTLPRTLNAVIGKGSLYEQASRLKAIYDILKDHLGDYLVESNFVVAVSRDNKSPAIHMIQPKINGIVLAEYVRSLGIEASAFGDVWGVDVYQITHAIESNKQFKESIDMQLTHARECLKLAFEDERWSTKLQLNAKDRSDLYTEIEKETLNRLFLWNNPNVMVDENGRIVIVDF